LRQEQNTHWHSFHGVQYNTHYDKSAIEKESDKKLNVLDLMIHTEHDKLNFTAYRKPIQTEILIHNRSCHPNEHKPASFNYLTKRLHSYPISKHAKDTELGIIKAILKETVQT
jgi:hypothetical protein